MVDESVGQVVLERYIRPASRFADVDVVLIPSLPDLQDVRGLLRRVDGVMLTGSPSNVEPWRYKDEAEGTGPFDPQRDETAMALVGGMVERGKPVFGICRGFQEINVAFGGRLRRDLGLAERELVHHAPDEVTFDELFEHRHTVSLTPGGVLARSFGAAEIEVNSVHYQGVARLAPGLAAEAVAPDGVVEAVRATDVAAPVLAVQWHPEQDPDIDRFSAAYFRLLGACLRGASLEEAAAVSRAEAPLAK